MFATHIQQVAILKNISTCK